MKRTYKIIAGLILAAGIGGVAIAQGGPRGMGCDAQGSMGPMMGMGPGGPMGRHAAMKVDPSQRAERHLAMLKYQLNVTDAQEPLWQAYEQKMKAEAGKGMQAFRTQTGDDKLTAPERMAKMQKLMQERVDAMAGVHDSFNRLYEALTPEQKQKADQFAASMGPGKGGKGGRMGGPGRMMPPAQPAPQS
ncbi:MAG: Spy/CpxP family protein refolding chaperone [Pseudomonadota bacterium]